MSNSSFLSFDTRAKLATHLAWFGIKNLVWHVDFKWDILKIASIFCEHISNYREKVFLFQLFGNKPRRHFPNVYKMQVKYLLSEIILYY